MHQQALSSPKSRLAATLSGLLPPAAVLLAVVVAAGFKAGVGLPGICALTVGTVALPALVYKGFPQIAKRLGVSPNSKTAVVSVLIVSGTAAVVLLQVPHPVFPTLASLILGNLLLSIARLRLNASAHVSVLTFGVLWWIAVFGPGFTWLVLLPPLMIFSRTSLGHHTSAEAIVGAAVGVGTFGGFLGLSPLLGGPP